MDKKTLALYKQKINLKLELIQLIFNLEVLQGLFFRQRWFRCLFIYIFNLVVNRPTRDCKRNSIAEFTPHKAEWLLLGQLQGGNSFQSPFGRGLGRLSFQRIWKFWILHLNDVCTFLIAPNPGCSEQSQGHYVMVVSRKPINNLGFDCYTSLKDAISDLLR